MTPEQLATLKEIAHRVCTDDFQCHADLIVLKGSDKTLSEENLYGYFALSKANEMFIESGYLHYKTHIFDNWATAYVVGMQNFIISMNLYSNRGEYYYRYFLVNPDGSSSEVDDLSRLSIPEYYKRLRELLNLGSCDLSTLEPDNVRSST